MTSSQTAGDGYADVEWKQDDLARVKYKVFEKHTAGVNSCCFCLDDSHILTASDDGTVRLVRSATMQEVRVYGGHTSSVSYCHTCEKNTKFVWLDSYRSLGFVASLVYV